MRQAKKQEEKRTMMRIKHNHQKRQESENGLELVDKDIFKNYKYTSYVYKGRGKHRHVPETYKDKKKYKLNLQN